MLRDGLRRLVVHTAASANGHENGAGNGSAPSSSGLRRLIELMRKEPSTEGAGSELVSHLSGALFALTLRFASEGTQAPLGLLALAGRPRLQAAISVMFDKPGEAWTLDQSRRYATCRGPLSSDTGSDCSATDVLTEVRMTIAGRALLETHAADIGESVGYQSDARAFSACSSAISA